MFQDVNDGSRASLHSLVKEVSSFSRLAYTRYRRGILRYLEGLGTPSPLAKFEEYERLTRETLRVEIPASEVALENLVAIGQVLPPSLDAEVRLDLAPFVPIYGVAMRADGYVDSCALILHEDVARDRCLFLPKPVEAYPGPVELLRDAVTWDQVPCLLLAQSCGAAPGAYVEVVVLSPEDGPGAGAAVIYEDIEYARLPQGPVMDAFAFVFRRAGVQVERSTI